MPSASLPPSRLIVGCMTGTSLDGLDCALVRITGVGLDIRVEVVVFIERPLGDLRAPLRALASQQPMTAGDIARLALDFGALHADAIMDLLAGRRADLIAVHGQTVFHSSPASWQMINPWPIAARTGSPVVYDLRAADLAAAGQGAPITPLADWILFRAPRPRTIINLGGFCNITMLPAFQPEGLKGSSRGQSESASAAPGTTPRIDSSHPEGVPPCASATESALPPIRGFDVCACNHILDGVARAVLGAPYDTDGASARAGTVHAPAALVLHRILEHQRTQGRSLGTGDEAAVWIDTHQTAMPPVDLAACAVDAIARTIANAAGQQGEVFCAGGGARNRALIERLAANIARPVALTDSLGVGIHQREAVAIAVLGALAHDRVPITLPAVTNRRDPAPIAGAWLNP